MKHHGDAECTCGSTDGFHDAPCWQEVVIRKPQIGEHAMHVDPNHYFSSFEGKIREVSDNGGTVLVIDDQGKGDWVWDLEWSERLKMWVGTSCPIGS